MVKDHQMINSHAAASSSGDGGGHIEPTTASPDHTNNHNNNNNIDHIPSSGPSPGPCPSPCPRACLHLHTFEFMTGPALAAASRAHLALGVASTALGRLYDPSLAPASHPPTTTHGNPRDHTHAHARNSVNNNNNSNNNNNITSASINATPPSPSPSHHHHHHHHHHSHHHSSSSTQVTDLTSIVTLARHCEDAYASFDAHFTRSIHQLHTVAVRVN